MRQIQGIYIKETASSIFGNSLSSHIEREIIRFPRFFLAEGKILEDEISLAEELLRGVAKIQQSTNDEIINSKKRISQFSKDKNSHLFSMSIENQISSMIDTGRKSFLCPVIKIFCLGSSGSGKSSTLQRLTKPGDENILDNTQVFCTRELSKIFDEDNFTLEKYSKILACSNNNKLSPEKQYIQCHYVQIIVKNRKATSYKLDYLYLHICCLFDDFFYMAFCNFRNTYLLYLFSKYQDFLQSKKEKRRYLLLLARPDSRYSCYRNKVGSVSNFILGQLGCASEKQHIFKSLSYLNQNISRKKMKEELSSSITLRIDINQELRQQ